MVQLRLGDNSIKFTQETFSEMEIIKKNEIGGLSSYEVDSNGNAERATFNVSNCFSDIKTIESLALYYVLYKQAGLTGSVNFPNLTSIGDDGLNRAFYECTGLTGSVGFPNLTSVGGYGLYYAFAFCTGITGSISFPSLTSIGKNGLFCAFSGCTGITELHFRADTKSVIESQSTYDSKFGATNATIYFDL